MPRACEVCGFVKGQGRKKRCPDCIDVDGKSQFYRCAACHEEHVAFHHPPQVASV